MKHILTLLLASASLSYGAANDLLIAQRNSTDTGQLTRLVAHPGGSNNGLVAFNGATLLPVCIQIGDGLVWSTGQLSALATQAVLDAKQDLISASDSSKYYRGDKTWATFPSIPNAQVQTDWSAVSGMGVLLNKPSLATVATSGAYSDLSGRPTLATVAVTGDYVDLLNKPTLGTAAAQNSTAFATAAQGVKADSALQPGWTGQNTVTTVGTISSGTWQGTAIANTYIASAGTWNAKFDAPSGSTSQYVRGNGTLATFPTIPAAQIQSDYAQTNNAALDFIKNKPAAASASSASRSFNSSFQVSTTRNSQVMYSVEISSSISLSGVNAGSIFLETSPDNSSWTEVGRLVNSQGGGLVIGLSLTQNIASQLSAFVPASYYVRIRSSATSGSPTFTYRAGQEVLLS